MESRLARQSLILKNKTTPPVRQPTTKVNWGEIAEREKVRDRHKGVAKVTAVDVYKKTPPSKRTGRWSS